MIVVVVLLVAASVAYEFFAATPPSVEIEDINVWAPDNVCGLSSHPIYYGGYNTSTGASVPVELTVPNYNATPCLVRDVRTNSTGFSVSSVQRNVTVPGLGNGTLNLTVTSPGSSFAGNLDLVFA